MRKNLEKWFINEWLEAMPLLTVLSGFVFCFVGYYAIPQSYVVSGLAFASSGSIFGYFILTWYLMKKIKEKVVGVKRNE